MTYHGNNGPSSESIDYLFHHLFLPPQLPQHDDFSIEYEQLLLEVVCTSLNTMAKQCASQHCGALDKVARMMSNMKHSLDVSGNIASEHLRVSLRGLVTSGSL